MSESSNCGFLMKQITDYISKTTNRQLREHDITLSQVQVLGFLYEKGENIPLKSIEAEFHISQPTVAGITRRLVNKELISLQTHPDNSSAKTASLTEKGKQVFLESRFYSRSMEQKITENLSQDEIQELNEILEKIINSTLF